MRALALMLGVASPLHGQSTATLQGFFTVTATAAGFRYVLADTLSSVRGRHSLKAGGEYRHFVNPAERNNQFVVFDARSASLLRVGVDVDEITRTRLSTGEGGSSRQIQLAAKLSF